MKYNKLAFYTATTLVLLIGQVFGDPLTTFDFYSESKAVPGPENKVHIPNLSFEETTFPIHINGKSYICATNLHTDAKTGVKTVDISFVDPSVTFSSGGCLTVFSGTYPFSDKKTLMVDSDMFSASFQVTQTGK